MKYKTRWKFSLGEKVRDKVSDFEGIITQRCEMLNGCIQYAVSPKIDNDGKKQDAWWIDEAQLAHLDEGLDIPKTGTGGPERRV